MAKIPLSKLTSLLNRLYVSYRAGVDVRTIWKREAKTGTPRFRKAVSHVAQAVDNGRSVADGMEAADGYFPELTIAVVAAGEEGGRLDRAFQLLQEHYDSLLKFRSEMQTSLAWPLFQLGSAILIIGALILVMGWVTSMSGGQPIDWLGLGWTTMEYFHAYVSFVLSCILAIGFFVFGVKEGWFGLLPMRVARRVPLLGKTIQIFALARFSWVIAATYEAGMDTFRALKLAFRATQNYYYQEAEAEILKDLRAGHELYEALRKSERFPSDLVMHVENGELTGELPESMNRLAEQYTDEAERNLSVLSKILFLLLFFAVAAIMIALIVTLYMRYLNTLNSFMP